MLFSYAPATLHAASWARRFSTRLERGDSRLSARAAIRPDGSIGSPSNCCANRLPVEGLRSKSWDEFARPGAPFLHFVFTVCDQAAAEMCPVWPGQPITAHWGLPDPAAVEGSDEVKRKAFVAAYSALNHRISIFVSLPLAKLDRLA